MKSFTLSEPTVFPELNQKEEKESNYARESIALQSLKYKHFRQIMKHPEEDQMHYLMMIITNLSDEDLGELTPDDAADISTIVLDSMQKYMELGKKIIKSMDN